MDDDDDATYPYDKREWRLWIFVCVCVWMCVAACASPHRPTHVAARSLARTAARSLARIHTVLLYIFKWTYICMERILYVNVAS